MGSSNEAKAKSPKAMFEFGIFNHDTQVRDTQFTTSTYTDIS